MTGYTVHTGSNEKFSSSWDRIFSGPAQSKAKSAKGQAKSSQSAKKATGKKKAGKAARKGS